MPPFDFIDLILFFGISQGIFLAVTIQIIKNKNRSANNILSLVLVMAALMLLGRMIYFKYLTLKLLQWTIIIDAIIFLFGPLCYTYFRRLAFSNPKNFKLSWVHYIPVSLHILFSLYALSLGIEEFSEKLSARFFRIPFKIIEGVGIVSNLYYWILNVRLLQAYSKQEKNEVSFKQSLVSFLIFFQISIGIFLTFWTVSYLSSLLFQYAIKLVNYDTVWALISVFIFVIGYYSLKEPELFRLYLKKEKPVSAPQRLPKDQIAYLEEKMKHLLEEEKIFLKPNLTLRDLAELLGTSTHNISWYLNTVSKSNFYDYINQYRIQEFLKKIENGEHERHTILALSIDVGFNSKSTFNKAFKEVMKDTPSNYIKRLKVA